MRLVVNNWILTTVKQNENDLVKNEPNLTIDQHIEQEQNLFDSSRSSSTDSESSLSNTISYRKSLNERILNEMERTSHTLQYEHGLHTDNFVSKIQEFLSENSNEQISPSSSSINSALSEIETARYDPIFNEETNCIKDFSNFLYNVLDVYTYRDVEIIINDFLKMRNYVLIENEFLTSDNNQMHFKSQKEIITYLKDTLRIKHLILSQSIGIFEQTRINIFQILEQKLSSRNLEDCRNNFYEIKTSYINRLEKIKTMLKLKINRLENSVNIWNDFEDICKNLDNLFDSNQIPVKCSLQYRSLSIEINNLINRLKEKLNLLTIVLNETKYFEFKNLIVIYEIKFKKFKELNDQTTSPEAIVPSSTKVTKYKHQECTVTPASYRKEEVVIPIDFEVRKRPVLTSDKSTFTVNNQSTQTESMYDAVIQSDGKKLLLEAYLRNNENMTSCSTSSKKNKSESGTGMTRESGIGTANDDESLPLTDVEKHDEDDKLNLSSETYPVESPKKVLRKKLNKLKSVSTLSTSSTSSSKIDEKNLFLRSKTKKSCKEISKIQSPHANESLFKCLIKKIIRFLLMFLIPILFILLVLAYVLYRSYLNPNCCDHKRNYLFINVT